MAKIQLRSGRELADYGKPYFVADVNSSHNGDVEVAKQMIIAAAEAGCDCVKFQSWSAESLYSASYYNDNPIAKRIVSKFSLSAEQLKEMAAFAREHGIDFSSTPYSCPEVDFLIDECKAPFVKISRKSFLKIFPNANVIRVSKPSSLRKLMNLSSSFSGWNTGMARSRAHTLTGEGVRIFFLPAGRSGLVRTPDTWLLSDRTLSTGTAMAGVPANNIFIYSDSSSRICL